MSRALRMRCAAATVLLAWAALLAGTAAADELIRDEASGLQYLEIITGGAAAADPLPVVIGMHGLGDHPESFRLLLDDLPAKARVVLPRAPTPYNSDGFSWFEFHPDDDQGAQPLAEGVSAAAERVSELIGSLARLHHGPPRAVVCGFSQGGMLSYALAVAHPELVAEAIPVSGYLPRPLWPAERPKTRPLPEIVALHGEADHLIPLESARWSVEVLRSNGYETSLRSWPGVGHALSPEMRATLLSAVVNAVEELSLATSASQTPVAPTPATPAPDVSQTPQSQPAPP